VPVPALVPALVRSVALLVLVRASVLDCWIPRGPLCGRFCALLLWRAGLR
jgi:hypothetical protein